MSTRTALEIAYEAAQRDHEAALRKLEMHASIHTKFTNDKGAFKEFRAAQEAEAAAQERMLGLREQVLAALGTATAREAVRPAPAKEVPAPKKRARRRTYAEIRQARAEKVRAEKHRKAVVHEAMRKLGLVGPRPSAGFNFSANAAAIEEEKRAAERAFHDNAVKAAKQFGAGRQALADHIENFGR